ncbi:DUF4358 domain-containing protein [Desulforamulus aeronauticus]|uniref:DUF4358 domain-containing protein n=1 Tax=Desulforamulus aeronauticus DSM 10349 TaxID=1121421 RepID=A0A1M6SZ44_9FIRM|nr:DUF4358 domain-containing protein [Desulforamulus aeronauticus]SHK49991.1 protein of unknown function [Desulforamulus aeronauticus DSM 10349]
MNSSFIKKGIVSLLLFLWPLSILYGCTAAKVPTKNPSFNEIMGKIGKTVDLSTLKEGNFAKLKRLYGISRGEIEEFAFYQAPSNIKADEIVLIKVKQTEDTEKVKEKLLKRVEKQAANFKDYLPEEYYLIEKNVLKVQNNYLLLVISPEAEKISEAFDQCFY